MKQLFRSIKIASCLMAIVTFVSIAIGPAANAATDMRDELAHGDIATVTFDIEATFSEFLTPITGVINWEAVTGSPSSRQNMARMTALRAMMPLAMVEGTAEVLVKSLDKANPSRSLTIASPDQGACLVGALVRGFIRSYDIEVAQDERNTLQALAYIQFDNHPSGITVREARQHLSSIVDWPKSVAGFELGYASDSPIADCGLSQQT